MKEKIRHYLKPLIPAARKWWKDRHTDDAAALAFYSLISLVPLLLISVYIASIVIDEETVKRIVINETDRVAGASVGKFFANMLHNDVKWSGASIPPFLGIMLIIFSATKMISELRQSLAKVFGTPNKVKKAYAGFISRLISFGVVLSLGGIIISAVAVETIITFVVGMLEDKSLLQHTISYIAPVTSVIGVVILSTFTMRWLPENKPNFKNALAGGILCAILLILLKVAITQTIKHTDIGGYYGSAFTLVLVLFWVYFTMQLFLYSAEYAAEISRQEKNDHKNSTPNEKIPPQRRDPFLS